MEADKSLAEAPRIVLVITFGDATLGGIAAVIRAANALPSSVQIDAQGMGRAFAEELERLYGVRTEPLPKALRALQGGAS